jgi:hypothetical protein
MRLTRRALAALLSVAALVAASWAAVADGAAGPPLPRAAGLTWAKVKKAYGEPLSFAPGSSVMVKGTNRVPFLLLDAKANVVEGAQVAVYTMRNDGTGVRGPFRATFQPFGVKPAYLSRTTASDPNVHKGFYVARVPSAKGGPTALFALARVKGSLLATGPNTVGLTLKRFQEPPAVGQKAIRMHTLTPVDTDGDYSKLTTRTPPDKDLVGTDFAKVVGRKPVVLVFATPLLCQSRVCGPTVDAAEQVKGVFGNRVAWVHQEIYVDNVVKKGLRPQVRKWRLPSEPWVFVIDAKGTIVARSEGAISVPELTAMVRRAL